MLQKPLSHSTADWPLFPCLPVILSYHRGFEQAMVSEIASIFIPHFQVFILNPIIVVL